MEGLLNRLSSVARLAGWTQEEGALQQALRAHGKLLGKRPIHLSLILLVVYSALVVGGWYGPMMGGVEVPLRMAPLASWAADGGSLWEQLGAWATERGDLSRRTPKALTTVITSRGGSVDDDLLTREVLAEVWQLYRRWHELYVVVDNMTYTMQDVCVRGNLPDEPVLCDRLSTTTLRPTSTVTSTSTTSTRTTTTTTRTTTPLVELDNPWVWEIDPDMTSTSTTQTTTRTTSTRLFNGGGDDDANGTDLDGAGPIDADVGPTCAPSPRLPCLTLSPFHCFREELEVFDERYRDIDPLIEKLDPFFLPYSSRPSLLLDFLGAVGADGADPRAAFKAALSGLRQEVAGEEDGSSSSSDNFGFASLDNQPTPEPGAPPWRKRRRPGAARGCHWFTKHAFFPLDAWAGHVTWSSQASNLTTTTTTTPEWAAALEGEEEEEEEEAELLPIAGSLRLGLYLDGTERIAQRLRFVRPELADEAMIEEALKLFEQRWRDEVASMMAAEGERSTESVLEAEVVEPMDDLRAQAEVEVSAAMPRLFVALFVGVSAVVCVLAPCCCVRPMRPQASHGGAAALGLLLVPFGLAIASAVQLLLFGEGPIEPCVLLAAPLLGTALGATDVLVFVRALSRLGAEYLATEENEEIMGELLATAGPGALLSSLVCIVSLAWGAVASPVESLRTAFASGILVAATNLVLSVTLLPLVMLLDARRIRAEKPDPHPLVVGLHWWLFRRANRMAEEWENEEPLDLLTSDIEGPTLFFKAGASPPPWVPLGAFVAAAAVLGSALGVSLPSVDGAEVALEWEDAVPPSAPVRRGLLHALSGNIPLSASLGFRGTEVAASQREFLELLDSMMVASSSDAEALGAMEFGFRNVLSTMYEVLYQDSLREAEPDRVAQLLREEPDLDPYAFISPLEGGVRGAWALPGLADHGVLPSEEENFTELYFELLARPNVSSKVWIPVEQGGDRTSLLFSLAGMDEFVWMNESSYDVFGNETKVPRTSFSSIPLLLANLASYEERLAASEAARKIAEASPLKDQAFLFSPPLMELQVFSELRPELRAALLDRLPLAALFASLVVLRFDLAPALVVCVCCWAAASTSMGCATMASLRLNPMFSGLVIAASGAAASGAAHAAAAFSFAQGRAPERLGAAVFGAAPAALVAALAIGGAGAAAPLIAEHLLGSALPPLFAEYSTVSALLVGGGALVGALAAPLLLVALGLPSEVLGDRVRSVWSDLLARQAARRAKPGAVADAFSSAASGTSALARADKGDS